MGLPTLVAPSSRTWLGSGREAATGTAVPPTSTIPLDKGSYEPEDTVKFLDDLAIRGSMSHRYATILGVTDATFSYGGPVFGDVWGQWLDNTFGDLSTTGTTPTSSTTTTELLAAGSTVTTVASISGYSSGSVVQIDTGAVAEVVVLSGAPSGSTLTFTANPLRFQHSSGVAVSVVTGPYAHKFGVLNQTASIGGTNGAQPPTHTATDWTGLTASVGARSYPSLCVSQLELTGNAEGLFMGKVSGNSWLSAPAGSAPTNSTSFTVPLPAWQSTVTIGGTQVYSDGEWGFTLKRELGVMWTAQGAQNPYIIARGDLDADGSAKFSVPSDESALNYMLTNSQPSLSVFITNGGTGTGLITCTITTTHADFTKAKPNRSGVLVGYDDSFQTHGNTTDVGGSGGLGQCTVTLVNNVPTY